MALYEYEILGPDGAVRGIYEAQQKMTDAALTHHSQTGEPLRRILSMTFGHTPNAKVWDEGCGAGSCGSGDEGFGGCCGGGGCGLN